MKISTLAARGKKEDEVPILPRFVSDSIINLQDEKKAEIEAVDNTQDRSLHKTAFTARRGCAAGPGGDG